MKIPVSRLTKILSRLQSTVSKMEFKHVSVLLDESIENLRIKPDGIYVDGTLGRGGHTEQILKRLTTGKVIAVDKDIEAIKLVEERLKEYGDKLILVHEDFKNLTEILDGLEIKEVDGVLLDLGVSSYQIDNPERGFSYRYDAKLDMRMDQSQYLTAFNVINEYNEKQLSDIFFKYGEERYSNRIANNIVKYRNEQSIRTTKQLVEIIEKSLPQKELHKGSHPAKKIFQAVRIEVNQELKDLDKIIEDLALRLRVGGRICVISFHSLEDRIVKQAFKYLELDCICDKSAPICTCNKRQEVKIITKKPILPSEKELEENPRSQSAKLRVCERI